MSQSPQRLSLKKKTSSSTSNLNRSKIYLPSRYAQPVKVEKSGFHDLLNSIQSQIHQDIIIQKPHSPTQTPKVKKIKLNQNTSDLTLLRKQNSSSNFKSRPLKRQQHDMLNFKEIFLNPRQQSLKAITKISQIQQTTKTITKQYEKMLKFQKGQENIVQENQKIENFNIKQSYQQTIELLESGDLFGVTARRTQIDFYDQPITLQVPVFNSTTSIISTSQQISAPSLPSNFKNNKQLNLRQLVLRAKAGTNSQDIQKQAHLSFYIGQAYAQKKLYKQALNFFKRFLGLAKIMEDRIGMSIGANRVGICYYKCKDYNKSISFHNQNLKLSEQENCFTGFYNIGICYRKLKKPQQALQYVESALNWAQERGQQQSECIALGQIGVTYQQMQLFQESVQKFEQSLQVSQRIKKKNLKLNNLCNILRISSMLKTKSKEQIKKITEDAFQCAKQLGEMHRSDVLRCNIGILKGSQQFFNKQDVYQRVEQIQQIL